MKNFAKKIILLLTILQCAAPAFSYREISGADNALADFPRLAGETSDSARIQRAIDASKFGVLSIPAGEYLLDKPVKILNGASLDMHKSAHFKAVAPMEYMLVFNGKDVFDAKSDYSAKEDYNIFIKGGNFDCNGLSGGVLLINYHHLTFRDSTIRNAKTVGLKINDEKRSGRGYELVASNIYMRCTMRGLAGNIGICLDDSDNHFIDCFVIDYTTGIFVRNGGSNRFTRCHVWGGPIPPQKEGGQREMLENSVCFNIRGSDTILTDCYADTGMTGFLIDGYGARLFGCSVFNNYARFKMDNPLSLHHKKGYLIVQGCLFSKMSPHASLYKGEGKELIWQNNIINKFSPEEIGLPENIAKTLGVKSKVY